MPVSLADQRRLQLQYGDVDLLGVHPTPSAVGRKAMPSVMMSVPTVVHCRHAGRSGMSGRHTRVAVAYHGVYQVTAADGIYDVTIADVMTTELAGS